jgi:hypothetical protein
MSYITIEQYLTQTNDGLDVFIHFYPEAQKSAENKNYKFSIRDEKTPSASMFFGKDKQWRLQDFGDKSYSCFDLTMKELNCEFGAALRFIEVRFNIQGEKREAKKNQSVYTSPEAPEGAVLDSQSWVIKENITVNDCKHIFSKNVWSYMQKLRDDDHNSFQKIEGDERALKRAIEIFERYNFHFLEKRIKVGKHKTTGKIIEHTFASTDDYPICMFQEGSWQKFYEPYSLKYRFASAGEKPKDYTFGLKFIQDTASSKDKFEDIIICTGGSDAFNVAGMGFIPVWFNSESVKPESIPFFKLKEYAYKIYNLPDIDGTGLIKAKELALHYLDIHTIYLPDELRKLKSGKYAEDGTAKFCKDVKDYMNKYGVTDFRNLLVNSYPLRFWTSNLVMVKDEPKIVDGKEVYKYSPHPVLTLNFLNKSGYGVLTSGGGQIKEFVQVHKNIVKAVQSSDMKTYIDQFLENRYMPWDLRTAFLRSKDIADSTLERLPRLDLNFDDNDRESQFMFFENEVWKVGKAKIEPIKAVNADRFVWDHEKICPKIWDQEKRVEKAVEVKLMEHEMFEIFRNLDGEIDIKIKDETCTFLNFLINTSRVHWRVELEDRLDAYYPDVGVINPNVTEDMDAKRLRKLKFNADYREHYKYRIDGILLTREEIQEQKQHLIAKICAMGYLLHRYKDEANTYAIWSMDYVMRDSDKSQGGTGKSLFGKSLFHLMQYTVLDGRDRNLTQNKHIFENVTEHTDYMLLDDGAKYLDFNFFFSSVTSFMKVNPKGTKGFDLMFKDTPKLHISSNFPPMEADDSTLRRLWFLAFSDYYHYNASGEYREQRLPKDEFGKNLFQNFDADEWNSFLNMAALSVKSYMNFGKMEPPMHELMANTFRNKLGPNFMQWANFFFQVDAETKEAENLNCYLHRRKMYESYKMEVPGDITPNGFKDKLVMYARMKYWNLNPKNVKYVQDDGRISKKVMYNPQFDNRTKTWVLLQNEKPKSEEFFYFQSDDKELTMNGLHEYDGVDNLIPTPDISAELKNKPGRELPF